MFQQMVAHTPLRTCEKLQPNAPGCWFLCYISIHVIKCIKRLFDIANILVSLSSIKYCQISWWLCYSASQMCNMLLLLCIIFLYFGTSENVKLCFQHRLQQSKRRFLFPSWQITRCLSQSWYPVDQGRVSTGAVRSGWAR